DYVCIGSALIDRAGASHIKVSQNLNKRTFTGFQIGDQKEKVAIVGWWFSKN
ncbi:unnamed protein product, partial [Brassica rapa subsp. trilocularis]